MGGEVTNPVKRLGGWEAKLSDTVYQAATDGFVLAYTIADGGAVEGRTDGSNPPTTIRTGNHCISGVQPVGFNMPVRKNDFWKVINANTVRWVPWEP